MKTEYLTESSAAEFTLTPHQAAELRRLGEALASQKGWWGETDGDSEVDKRSVIQCRHISDSQYTVRVSDAVGIIGVDDLQLIVRPKIPLPHLLFLLAEANQLPRTLYERSRLNAGESFFDIIARWFVHTCESLLRHGLVHDYGRMTGDLNCARGRIHTVKTFQSVLAGRPSIRCDFDHFGEDTQLNRVVKAAALNLLWLPGLPQGLRERCRRIVYRLSDVGDLRGGDIAARPDALSRRYRDAHPLALSILSSTGISLVGGGESTWTFLFRTPEPIEEGLRNTLQRHLQPDWKVKKTAKILLGDRNRRLNPDLVFGDNHAVGDVKYRLTADGDIRRSDLNQVTTFATGYHAHQGTVVAFGKTEVGEKVHVGPILVNGFNWNCNEASPEQASSKLAEHLRDWLNLDSPIR